MSKLDAHGVRMRNVNPRKIRLGNIFVLGTDLTTEGERNQIRDGSLSLKRSSNDIRKEPRAGRKRSGWWYNDFPTLCPFFFHFNC